MRISVLIVTVVMQAVLAVQEEIKGHTPVAVALLGVSTLALMLLGDNWPTKK